MLPVVQCKALRPRSISLSHSAYGKNEKDEARSPGSGGESAGTDDRKPRSDEGSKTPQIAEIVMANDESNDTANQSERENFAKAFQELAKGEQTAAALENHLNAMEAKIEALLSQAESQQREMQQHQSENPPSADTHEEHGPS